MHETKARDAVLFWPRHVTRILAGQAGFRFGNIGTHTSRTIMVPDLTTLFSVERGDADRQQYAAAIIEANCLGKPTISTRRLSNQRLGELYGLDPRVAIFRVLRRLWEVETAGRPLLAILVAIARDPLLMATAISVLSLRENEEFSRDRMNAALRESVGDRLNESVMSKVVRNAASSWTQSGHLIGRTFKRRAIVNGTPAALSLAVYLGHLVGFRGRELLSTGWVSVLGCSPTSAEQLALSAKRLGLIDLRVSGEVFEIGLDRMDPTANWKAIDGEN